MSDSSSVSELDLSLLSQYSAVLTGAYFTVSASVLIIYDFLLTFPMAKSHVWTGGLNVMKVLFIMNQVSSLVYVFSNLFDGFYHPASNTECRVMYFIQDLTPAFFTFSINAIFTLRVFAIYGKNWFIFVILSIPGILQVATWIWAPLAEGSIALPQQLQVGPYTCEETGGSTSAAASLTNIVSGGIFDGLVFLLTVYRTLRLARQSMKANITRSVTFILLRDGILYYVVIFFPIWIILALDSMSSVNSIYYASLDLSNILIVIEIIATNRLVLNLSHTANAREDSEFRTRTAIDDPPVFATNSFLGNIGAPVRTLPDSDEPELEEEVFEARAEEPGVSAPSPRHAPNRDDDAIQRNTSDIDLEINAAAFVTQAGSSSDEVFLDHDVDDAKIASWSRNASGLGGTSRNEDALFI